MRVFNRTKEDYQREMADLKTKNELYQIEKMALDINFDTGLIEETIGQKNTHIASLEN